MILLKRYLQTNVNFVLQNEFEKYIDCKHVPLYLLRHQLCPLLSLDHHSSPLEIP